MAATFSIQSISSWMECSLCLATFRKPKCLPCIHTFCLDCLQNYVDKNKIRDKLPCPLCCEVCTVPSQGLGSLPINFFIQNMIELADNAGEKSENINLDTKCDLCIDEKDADRSPAAVKYCPDCDQNMCTSCTSCHGNMKLTKSHIVVLLSEKNEATKIGPNLQRSCDKHRNEPLRMYCESCDIRVCVLCMAGDHNGHEFETLEHYYAKYRDQLDNKLLMLREALTSTTNSVIKCNALKVEIVLESSKTEHEIKERCNEMRKLLDNYEEELMCEARQFRRERMAEIKSWLDEKEEYRTTMESFIIELEQMKEKGYRLDTTRCFKELAARAEDLLWTGANTVNRELKLIKMKFIPNNEHNGFLFERKLVGQLFTGDKLFVIAGLNKHFSCNVRKTCRISLDKQDTVHVTHDTPDNFLANSAAYVVNNEFYAVGVKTSGDGLWKWSASLDKWMPCADLPSGRTGHCVTSVGDKLYAVGGYSIQYKRTLADILSYDINSNRWTNVDALCHAVDKAACLAYKQSIYVFGGSDADDNAVGYMQIYNTVSGLCECAFMPNPAYGLRAVLWRSKALLVGFDVCYIHDFERNVWETKYYGTGVEHFGLTLDDNVLYISGGGTCSNEIWNTTAEVMSLSVDDFISENVFIFGEWENGEFEWEHYARLPVPTFVDVYSPIPMYSLAH